tara:strand:- start:923 stop:1132 length:210 start_codon:yes stop_codon:yes gene_type:complete
LDENIGIHINDHTISFFDLSIKETEKRSQNMPKKFLTNYHSDNHPFIITQIFTSLLLDSKNEATYLFNS